MGEERIRNNTAEDRQGRNGGDEYTCEDDDAMGEESNLDDACGMWRRSLRRGGYNMEDKQCLTIWAHTAETSVALPNETADDPAPRSEAWRNRERC